VELSFVAGSLPANRAAAAPARAEWALRAQNPARAGTTIEFSLPSDGDVTLDVIDAAGRRVATLAEGTHSAGTHRVTWTGQTGAGRAAPGVYMLRLDERPAADAPAHVHQLNGAGRTRWRCPRVRFSA
jgi:hypothetical protein